MTHDIRLLTDPADLARAFEVFAIGLGATTPEGADPVELTEPGRLLGAFVPIAGAEPGEQEMVGTAGAFGSWLVVPGGARVAQCAVTDVGVLPTHTRQGIATAMLGRQLEEIAARGEAIATLRASEATIYERFGYGCASSVLSAELVTARARVRPGVPAGGPVRFVDAATARDLLPRIYDGVGFTGATGRPALWWRGVELSAGRPSEGQRVVVHGEPGAEDGFLRYRVTSGWASPEPTITVDDLVAQGSEAFCGLVRFLLSIDLMRRIVVRKLPVDHGVEELLLDRRAVRTTEIADETWLRLIDVEAALSARAYALTTGPAGGGGAGPVTIEVEDRQLTANTGRYRIDASGVKRTEDAADLSVDVATLGAAYLGGPSWRQLALAGRVRELTPGALASADDLFRTPRAPYAGTMF